jgi:hypothetical protein
MADQLLYDLVGIDDKELMSDIVRFVTTRLGLPQLRTYIVRDAAFLRDPSGPAPTEGIERALGELEEQVAEGFRLYPRTLADFSHVLLVRPPGEPTDLIAQLAEEVARRTGRLPAVVAVQVEGNEQERSVTIVDAPALPLKWRCQQGGTVILTRDVWLEGDYAEEGANPILARGQPMLIVERSVYDGERLNGECFLTITTLPGQDTPLPFALPWQLVAHPSGWLADEPVAGSLRAVATFRLPCWYVVQIEERAGDPAADPL